MSQIITVSRYKPSEDVQLPALLKIWGYVGKTILEERVSESKLE